MIVGVGAGTEATDMVLNIGPQHPSTHGVLRLRLRVDGERVTECEPIIGYMHRGAEKLYEVRDFRQIMLLANRHDWLSAFSSELGVALAAERLAGVEVPERAVWLRMALAEMNRVLNHLMFLGSYPLEIGAITPMFYAFTERERLQAVMEEASGGRIHYMYNCVGGLKADVPSGWEGRAHLALDAVEHGMVRLDKLLRHNEIFAARTKGVGVLDAATAAAYGVTGPVARASGLDFDLRRDEPYLAYSELDVPIVTRTEGDCYARFICLLDQVAGLDRPRPPMPGAGGEHPRTGERQAAEDLQTARSARPTCGPRTLWAPTGTTWSAGARRPRGGSSSAPRPTRTSKRCRRS